VIQESAVLNDAVEAIGYFDGCGGILESYSFNHILLIRHVNPDNATINLEVTKVSPASTLRH
jgi:hypothetical protein